MRDRQLSGFVWIWLFDYLPDALRRPRFDTVTIWWYISVLLRNGC